ncbi:hypothetical protein LUZ60_000381 [Juncus effusus]|nr:hypothetical protein LUZ60_000381 [Juncus effusus]
MSPKLHLHLPKELNHLPTDLEQNPSTTSSPSSPWPLEPIDLKRSKFPCCIVWTPLPVVSWLAPLIGHVGICCEDGTMLDFAGSNLVSVDNFAFGAVARYLPLDRKKCCFPTNMGTHSCTVSYRHSDYGMALSWDEVLNTSMRNFQHKFYNLFTCNCHSFVANCLNRLAYNGSVEWNVVNLGMFILWEGKWVDKMAVIRAFFPFILVIFVGVFVVGWPFLVGMMVFPVILIGWFVLGVYCFKGLIC